MPRRFRSGRMRRNLITIQARSTDLDDQSPNKSFRDGHAGASPVWSNVASGIRAGVESFDGREFFSSGQRQNETLYRVVFHYKAYRNISAEHRITVTLDAEASPNITKTLDVESVTVSTDLSRVTCICSEGPRDG